MTLLLRPDALTRLETLRACEDVLRAVAPDEARVVRLLDGERREELSTVAGWFAVAERLAPGREPTFEERREWDTLRRELESAFRGEATTPLGRSLASVALARGLPAEPFRDFLAARDDDRVIGVRQTRVEVERHARRRAAPVGRALLPLLGADEDRARVLADALCTGCQLASWCSEVGRAWRLEGRLVLPMEDVLEHEVDLATIDRGEMRLPFARLMADEITWARAWLGKGWGLTRELGIWRGRLLAYALRRRLHRLDAIARSRFDVLRGVPEPGRTSALLAALASVVTRRRPGTLPGPSLRRFGYGSSSR